MSNPLLHPSVHWTSCLSSCTCNTTYLINPQIMTVQLPLWMTCQLVCIPVGPTCSARGSWAEIQEQKFCRRPFFAFYVACCLEIWDNIMHCGLSLESSGGVSFPELAGIWDMIWDMPYYGIWYEIWDFRWEAVHCANRCFSQSCIKLVSAAPLTAMMTGSSAEVDNPFNSFYNLHSAANKKESDS